MRKASQGRQAGCARLPVRRYRPPRPTPLPRVVTAVCCAQLRSARCQVAVRRTFICAVCTQAGAAVGELPVAAVGAFVGALVGASVGEIDLWGESCTTGAPSAERAAHEI